ncbi:alpha/beta hydrolase [Saccharothrix sp. ST-888]|uniref:alpha/beta hydrolase n=1 Tax=Saccharothrix sp. ST-888 TaxID=1427391 RepID=UPI000AAECA58|nr:alpha/beta hydrolase [Saccharothrix sp. ST-888]
MRLRRRPHRAATAPTAATAALVRAAAPVLGAALLTGCATGQAGLPAVPATPGPSSASAGVAAGTDLAAGDHNISFLVDGTTTYGTLHIPARPAGGTLPAALLLPDGGPTDRDGNQPQLKPDTLAGLAQLMGDDGIATLRYDKYGTGLTGLGAYAGRAAAPDLAAFVRQADAAYRFLAARPTTDPHRLLLAGHGEGAMVALEVATLSRPAPAGLALLAPQDERLLDLTTLRLDQQLDATVATDRLTAAQAATVKEAIAQAVAELRAGGTADTTGMPGTIATVFEGFNDDTEYVRTDDAVHPPDLARRLTGGTRTMVTCGSADPDIPCSTTGPLVAALAAAGTTGPGLVTLPDVDHLLRPADSPTDTTTLAPAARQAVHAFDALWH